MSLKSLNKRIKRVETVMKPSREVRSAVLVGTREEIRRQVEAYKEAGIVLRNCLVIDISGPEEDESEEV